MLLRSGGDDDSWAQGVKEAGHPAGAPVESHASMGAVESTNRTMGELMHTTKHVTETKVGGRLPTNPLHRRFHMRPDGRTPHELLRNQKPQRWACLVLGKSFGHDFPE